MPKHKSPAKRMKTSENARVRNRKIKTDMRSAIKAVASEKDKDKKAANLKAATSALDKAAGKNVIHKNKAARTKSRLTKKVNA